MKKRIIKILYILGLTLWAGTFIYSLLSIFVGIDYCMLSFSIKTCPKIYGFRALGQIWFVMLNKYYVIYLILALVILFKKQQNRISIKQNLLYSIMPILLSLLIFLCACLAKIYNSTYIIFIKIYKQNIWIIISIIIGIINIIRITFKKRRT